VTARAFLEEWRMQGRLRVLVAALTVVALPASTVAPALAGKSMPAGSPAPGVLEGTVLATGGGPVEGAVVLVRHLGDASERSSAPTESNGAYRLDGLSVGQYEIAVKTEEGLYLGARAIQVSGLGGQSYSFRIEDRSAAEMTSYAETAKDETEGKEGEEKAPPEKKKRRGALWLGWNNPLTVLAAGLAFVISTSALIDAVDEEDEPEEDDDASPSGP
jgi:hypothetical protein